MKIDIETAVSAWARDANGGCQRFTGKNIHQRAGQWCNDRLVRNVPVVITYLYHMEQCHFTIGMGIVPDAAIPMLTYLRPPDKIDERRSIPAQTWLVYEHLEDA